VRQDNPAQLCGLGGLINHFIEAPEERFLREKRESEILSFSWSFPLKDMKMVVTGL
jgi:hypothetical protein